MKQGKETKPTQESAITGFNPDEFFTNRLSLPDALKQRMTKEGLDWRFINAQQFRSEGNVHRSHWTPYIVKDSPLANAEGLIARGDLILGVRPKSVTDAHRKYLKGRNNLQKGHNKAAAQELKKMVRDAGLGEGSRVHEGYEEND